MSGILITDGEIVDQTPMKTERMKAMELGKKPGETIPPVYLCGSCGAVRIEPDQGICKGCDRKLANREAMELSPPFAVRLVAIVGGFAILTIAYWLLHIIAR